jgi:hypothetical protein
MLSSYSVQNLDFQRHMSWYSIFLFGGMRLEMNVIFVDYEKNSDGQPFHQ